MMRSNNNILRKQSLRFMLCAFALSLSPLLSWPKTKQERQKRHKL